MFFWYGFLYLTCVAFYLITLKYSIMTTRNKLLLGIVGAAAAGVIVGLLLAPEKGKDTRKKIKKTAGEWAESLSHLWDKGKKAADDFVDEAKDKVRQGRSSAEEKANKIKESYS
jgi:gas vesicle protein